MVDEDSDGYYVTGYAYKDGGVLGFVPEIVFCQALCLAQ
jgi:hypothetical protein